MSSIRTTIVNLGLASDLTKNFIIDGSKADGTLTLSRENGQVILNVDAAGAVTIPGLVGGGGGGGGGTTTILNASVTLPATAGAVASGLLGASSTGMIVLLVDAVVTAGTAQNYALALYDGDPTTTGVLVYQSTGITVASYRDTAMFYQPILASGNMYVKITNIDADAITVSVSLTYMSA